MRWVGIDPGSSSGALAIVGEGFFLVQNLNCESNLALYRQLKGLLQEGDKIVVEHVGGSMPGNAARAARTFAAHNGALHMALDIIGIPWQLIAPQVWMRKMFGDALPKGMTNKGMRKEYIYNWVISKHTGMVIRKGQADACALAHYAKDF